MVNWKGRIFIIKFILVRKDFFSVFLYYCSNVDMNDSWLLGWREVWGRFYNVLVF